LLFKKGGEFSERAGIIGAIAPIAKQVVLDVHDLPVHIVTPVAILIRYRRRDVRRCESRSMDPLIYRTTFAFL